MPTPIEDEKRGGIMETTERQPAAEGLIGRAATTLPHREPSFAQADADPRSIEQTSTKMPYTSKEDGGLVEAFAERIRDTARFSPPASPTVWLLRSNRQPTADCYCETLPRRM
jgi:hypothetical protein